MTVEPSSALRSCTVVYLTSSRPHLGHFSCAVLSVCRLCFSTACTLDCSFCLRKDGKSEGFVCVTVTLEPVSASTREKCRQKDNQSAAWEANLPLFSAPQHSQRNTFLCVPLVAGRRLPQSVQKTRVPIAAIVFRWVKFAQTDFGERKMDEEGRTNLETKIGLAVIGSNGAGRVSRKN